MKTDHGSAQDAIDFVLDGGVETICGEAHAFMLCWREGLLEEWPEYHEWLARRRNMNEHDKAMQARLREGL